MKKEQLTESDPRVPFNTLAIGSVHRVRTDRLWIKISDDRLTYSGLDAGAPEPVGYGGIGVTPVDGVDAFDHVQRFSEIPLHAVFVDARGNIFRKTSWSQSQPLHRPGDVDVYGGFSVLRETMQQGGLYAVMQEAIDKAPILSVTENVCVAPFGEERFVRRSTVVDLRERIQLLNKPAFATALNKVVDELVAATTKHPTGMRSAHEGYAILAEEVDELWDVVKRQNDKRSKDDMRAEAVQIAAMAIRFMVDVCR